MVAIATPATARPVAVAPTVDRVDRAKDNLGGSLTHVARIANDVRDEPRTNSVDRITVPARDATLPTRAVAEGASDGIQAVINLDRTPMQLSPREQGHEPPETPE